MGSRKSSSMSEVPLSQEVSEYSAELSLFIKGSQMFEISQLRRRNERLYRYNRVISDACNACYRGTELSKDGDRCIVWRFDGRVWVQMGAGIFRDVVGESLIRACSCGAGDSLLRSSGDFVVMGDWVEKSSYLMKSAYTGVCQSPLDARPSVVGFSNGVWDFGDVFHPVYHPFSDRQPVTHLLPYAYDEDAVCPIWESFLKMMLPSRNDRLKLQKYLGLGVCNPRRYGHSIEDTLWLVGSGANGKSTILNVVRDVYGSEMISNASMSSLLDRNTDVRLRAIYSIEGRVFNLCSESDLSDMTKGSDAFKRLCSGEPQQARGLGRDVHEAKDLPFLIFAMNQRPANYRMDDAIRRRIVEIRFDRKIRPEDVDTSLGERLRGELSGIRNWMIEGYKLLVRDRFQFSHVSDEEYMESNGQYFDLFMEHEGLRPSAWAGSDEKARIVKISVLRGEYVSFCRRKYTDVDEQSLERSMGRDATRLGYNRVRKNDGYYYEVYCDRDLDYVI